MKRYLVIFFAFLFANTNLFAQNKQNPLTIEKALSLHYRVSNPSISPDEKRIAFVVTEPIKGDTPPNKDIWMYEIGTNKLFQYTRSPKSDNTPKWSPDGQSLAFLSSRNGKTQLFLISMNGGEAFPITKSKTPVRNFEWSPDGKQIAYLAAEPETEEEETKKEDKDDETVVGDDKPTRLWILDVAEQTTVQKTDQNWKIDDMKWQSNSQSLILKTQTLPEPETPNPSLVIFDLKENTFSTIKTPGHAFWRGVQISPDDKHFAYLGARTDGPTSHDLFLQPIGKDKPQNLTSKADLLVSRYQFQKDGRIFFTAQKGFYRRLYTIDNDKSINEYPLDQNIDEFNVSSDGMIAFISSGSTNPEELWLSLKNQPPTQITHFNESFEEFNMVKPEIVQYKSFDGTVIEGSFFKPEGISGELPLVVMVHGGPTGAWTDSFRPGRSWAQYFIERGYAVFCPNIRGSVGYGWKFIESNKNDWGGADYKDIISGIDYLIGRGGIDANRLGIAGWSYGGYMTMWAVTQTNRFKAAMAGAGLSDLASEYGTEGSAYYDRWYFGTPYENLANFTKSSPITFIKNAKTPTLIIQGENDTVDPIGQSQQFYRGLRHYGVTTELVTYPREPHGFSEEKHIVDYINRMLDWFDKYIKND